jgi:hypothetical protein
MSSSSPPLPSHLYFKQHDHGHFYVNILECNYINLGGTGQSLGIVSCCSQEMPLTKDA